MDLPRAIRLTIRGCGYLPGYGSHPGTPFLALMVMFGAVAGVERGWRVGVLGAAIMLLVFGPMFLWGSYDRARSHERRSGAPSA